jgi:hypothetical protein
MPRAYLPRAGRRRAVPAGNPILLAQTVVIDGREAGIEVLHHQCVFDLGGVPENAAGLGGCAGSAGDFRHAIEQQGAVNGVGGGFGNDPPRPRDVGLGSQCLEIRRLEPGVSNHAAEHLAELFTFDRPSGNTQLSVPVAGRWCRHRPIAPPTGYTRKYGGLWLCKQVPARRRREANGFSGAHRLPWPGPSGKVSDHGGKRCRRPLL